MRSSSRSRSRSYSRSRSRSRSLSRSPRRRYSFFLVCVRKFRNDGTFKDKGTISYLSKLRPILISPVLWIQIRVVSWYSLVVLYSNFAGYRSAPGHASLDSKVPDGYQFEYNFFPSNYSIYYPKYWKQCSGSVSTFFGDSRIRTLSHRYGSGSFYHQAKIAQKTLIPTVLWFLLVFYRWKMM